MTAQVDTMTHSMMVMIMMEINREKVNNLHDFEVKMNKLDTEGTMLLLIKRGGSTIYVAVKMQ